MLQSSADSIVISEKFVRILHGFPELRVFWIEVRSGSQLSSAVGLRCFNRPIPFFILLIAFQHIRPKIWPYKVGPDLQTT